MDDFTEKNIDALFQEGSEQYDFTYREDAWASMDEMLDKQDKKRSYRLIGWWLVIGITALTGIFGLKYYNSNNELAEPKERLEQNFATTEKAITTDEHLATNTNNTEEAKEPTQTATTIVTKKENLESAQIIDTKTEAITTTELPKVLDNENLKTKNHTETIATTTLENLSSKVETKVQEDLRSEPVSTQSKDIVSQKQTRMLSTVSKSERLEHTKPGLLLPSGKASLLVNNTDQLSSIQLPTIINNDSKVGNNDQSKSPKRFSYGLSIGSEISFIAGEGERKAGYFVGLELGYQLNKHFELITGVGLSKKEYSGSGENYKAKPGFWTDAITPMEFRGSCTVIEIPLSVNYYFNDVNENGWFTNIGATTYLMSSEWYDFIYDPAIDNSNLKKNWNDKLANKHLLGVAQVSFGYQRTIGKHTSLQISPYAKIPLTGIGNGSVNLFSTGIRLTARLK